MEFKVLNLFRNHSRQVLTRGQLFNVSEDKISEMEAFLKQYTDEVEPEMTYRSKGTIMAVSVMLSVPLCILLMVLFLAGILWPRKCILRRPPLRGR